VSPLTAEPFRSGEAIRLGQSKQAIIIELFRKFVEAAEESELVVQEAQEKVKAIEKSLDQQKSELDHLIKQSQNIKTQIEKESSERIELAQQQAEEIKQSALKWKDEIIQKSERDATLIAQKAEKEIERTINEIQLNSEEKKRALLDQARVKAKEIKQEAETEAEAIVASGQREADLLIAAAKNKAREITEDGHLEIQVLQTTKDSLQNEIKVIQSARAQATQEIAATKLELGRIQGEKDQLYKGFELEKERLRLSSEDLRKNTEALESNRRALASENAALKEHFDKVNFDLAQEKASAQSFLDKCSDDSQKAISATKKATAELDQSHQELETINKRIIDSNVELAKITERISGLTAQEERERDQIRTRLKKEYEVRLEFEKKWLTKRREEELDQQDRERTARAKVELERLNQQAQSISEGIQSVLGLELVAQFGEESSLNLKPQFEKVIPPIVLRCVKEEYEYRRENWEKIRPYSFATELHLRAKKFKRQIGVTTISLLFLTAALTVTWISGYGTDTKDMSSQSCSTVTRR
jgi:hypothetical protein